MVFTIYYLWTRHLKKFEEFSQDKKQKKFEEL